MATRRLGLTALAALAVPAVLAAQPGRVGSLNNRAPEKDASLVMITSFKAPTSENPLKDKGIGYLAAEEMRKKVEDAFPAKQIYVFPVDRINPQLQASNFSTTEGLTIHDAKQLAIIMRADEFIQGSATRTATGVKVEADLVLSRDINALQPLGVAEAPRVGDAVAVLVKELKEARKQLDGEKKCYAAARDQKFDAAIQFAKDGIAAYPKATIARACLLNSLYSSKAPMADVVKVAQDLVALDPRSLTALKFIAQSYRDGGESKSDSLVITLVRMMQLDPSLQAEAITEIAGAKNPAIARPIIDSAVVQNPGDPELLVLRWKILGAVKDYKEMFKAGKELVRLDTALADTTYFESTANAYAADSNFVEAAATAGQGFKKFPTDVYLAAYEIQMLVKAGQLEQALEKLNGAIAAKVPVPNAGTQKLLILQQMKSPLVVSAAKEMLTAGDTTFNVRQIILNELQTQYTTTAALMKTDVAAATDSFTVILTSLKEADAFARPGPQKAQVAFLMGASNTNLAGIKAQLAGPAKSCALAKEARAYALAGMTYLPAGAAFAPAAVAPMMANAGQYDSFADQLMKSLPACK
ncbi:MAG: hypothetical protein ABJB74_07445 [Gemmatimonas sp.]